MDPIEEINIQQVVIPQLDGRSWMYQIPAVPNNDPPVTIQLGFPIVELPGCVEAHPDNKIGANNLPLDRNLVNDDENNVTILCPNGEYPSYDAMNYEPEQIVPTTAAPPPPVAPPAPEIPNTGDIVTSKKEIECPAPNQPRVGDLTQKGDERVIGHEVQNGQCVVLYEATTVVEKYLPSTNQVSTTAAIAVVATASAAATPLLLRVIKPIIKKATDFVKKKLGKKIDVPTRAEIQTNKYREKKGLPPIKKKN